MQKIARRTGVPVMVLITLPTQVMHCPSTVDTFSRNALTVIAVVLSISNPFRAYALFIAKTREMPYTQLQARVCQQNKQ